MRASEEITSRTEADTLTSTLENQAECSQPLSIPAISSNQWKFRQFDHGLALGVSMVTLSGWVQEAAPFFSSRRFIVAVIFPGCTRTSM